MEQYMREFSSDVDPRKLEAALVKRNTHIEESIMELEELVAKKSPLAMAALGNIYLYGSHGVEIDIEKGISLLSRSYQAGSIEGGYRLACFFDSKGNHGDAFEIYEKLAKAEFSPALYRLAWAYYDGRWVEKDLEYSRILFLQAYRAGHLLAQQNLSFELRNSKKLRDKIFGIYLIITLIAPRAYFYKYKPNSDRIRD